MVLDLTSISQRIDALGTVQREVYAGRPANRLMSTHKSKVQLPNKGMAVFGREGMKAVSHMRYYDDAPLGETVFSIGHFSQTSHGCEFLLGGEHANGEILNNTFASPLAVRERMVEAGVHIHKSYSRGPIVVGSNVTLSHNILVRSGVTIGDGAVIGMGAVVVKDVPPFAIVGGNPAKVLNYRFDPIVIEALLKTRWWDIKPTHLHKVMGRILELKDAPDMADDLLASGELIYDDARDYLVFEAHRVQGVTNMKPLGVERDGVFTPIIDLPDSYKYFFLQFNKPAGSQLHVIEDIFALDAALT